MSSIKLKHSSGNSMSIAAPATNPASDLELKLPATIGTADQVLKNSSTPGTLEFGSVGDYVKLATASGDDNISSIIHESIDFSVYRALFFCGALIPETNNTTFKFNWRSGGSTSTEDDYAYVYTYTGPDSDGDPQKQHTHNTDNDKIIMSSQVGDDDNEGLMIEIFMYPISDTDSNSSGIGNFITWQGSFRNGSHYFSDLSGSGWYNKQNVSPDGFRIMPSSGNFDHYNYSLYGIKR